MLDHRPASGTSDEPSADVPLAEQAEAAMIANGFETSLSATAAAEVAALDDASRTDDGVRDARALPWSSIDNVDTLDLDQLEVAHDLGGGATRVLVAVADVDALVPKDGAVDARAAANTTSVYTGVRTFNMLPERLSTDLTSLRLGADRLAVVVEFTVDADGAVIEPTLYRALVRNRAQLAYETVAAWLNGTGEAPPAVLANPEIEAQLRMQDAAAERLRGRRVERGALQLETVEARPVMRDGVVVDLELVEKSRARALIEDFMIAANVSVATWIAARGCSSVRRVVRAPDRWPRLVALAAASGEVLPPEPDAPALSAFLARRRAADPARFGDLSTSVVKLLGAGKYAIERAGGVHEGHFGLAVDDYAHSTAPNRRYADLVTQRVVKAALAGAAAPYDDDALALAADRCTLMENAAHKVERLMRKKAAALLLDGRVGDAFDAIVTGAKPHATYVRTVAPPVEGRVVRGEQGLDVGDTTRVKLVATEPTRGFIDFVKV